MTEINKKYKFKETINSKKDSMNYEFAAKQIYIKYILEPRIKLSRDVNIISEEIQKDFTDIIRINKLFKVNHQQKSFKCLIKSWDEFDLILIKSCKSSDPLIKLSAKRILLTWCFLLKNNYEKKIISNVIYDENLLNEKEYIFQLKIIHLRKSIITSIYLKVKQYLLISLVYVVSQDQ
ncbi:hypothetical protein H312_02991 [Anncaliia algerae PRA339]|uniref:Uncharacterized protein n=1 Tax=Anncaliia algerae PRA339 TaxID=1288291 RepID=A0A059EX79_9MICR|nr:hypothetical protein H312_02991 [Anncaliia algerae PRA339]